MKVKVISITVGILEMLNIGLEKRQEEFKIKGRIVIIQTTVVLRSARILKRILET